MAKCGGAIQATGGNVVMVHALCMLGNKGYTHPFAYTHVQAPPVIFLFVMSAYFLYTVIFLYSEKPGLVMSVPVFDPIMCGACQTTVVTPCCTWEQSADQDA
jgi:hypothetical protein